MGFVRVGHEIVVASLGITANSPFGNSFAKASEVTRCDAPAAEPFGFVVDFDPVSLKDRHAPNKSQPLRTAFFDGVAQSYPTRISLDHDGYVSVALVAQ